jgi:hypothetical protein
MNTCGEDISTHEKTRSFRDMGSEILKRIVSGKAVREVYNIGPEGPGHSPGMFACTPADGRTPEEVLQETGKHFILHDTDPWMEHWD